MQLLPGFRDFYPEDCARRNYILTKWREVARRYGFVEYDGPVLEPMALYEKKSGGELVGQLFDFTDKGERHVAMRPEMTPTLARMVAARERDFKKPLKWFCVPQCFRYEKQQRGRLREFYQLNCDIIGEASPAADAELIAVQIDMLRALGLTEHDFVVRLSTRDAWRCFLTDVRDEGDGGIYGECEFDQLLAVIDKLERQDDATSNKLLDPLGIDVGQVRRWKNEAQRNLSAAGSIADISLHGELVKLHETIHSHLAPRDLLKYITVDLGIVRGLAYYNGIVFEVFDRGKNERAISGGGRYDNLLSLMSDDKVDLPALGFGMGDVVLANLIDDTPAAKSLMDTWIAGERPCEVFVVIAKEERRPEALALVQRLRDAGHRTDFPLTPAKVGKQFQTAEHLGARTAILVGDEWPQVKVKTLATREEVLVPHQDLAAVLAGLRPAGCRHPAARMGSSESGQL